jgi:uncharacterized protein YjbJ (UPF0337 family)
VSTVSGDPAGAEAGLGRLEHTHRRGRCGVGLGDKIDNKAEELKGKAKVATGKATDDEELEAEGHVDQVKGNIKQAGEKIKDVFKS